VGNGNRVFLAAMGVSVWAVATGCDTPPHAGSASVSRAWQAHLKAETKPGPAQAESSNILTTDPVPVSGRGGEPIATVNGRPLPRRRLVDMLLRSHGGAMLEQLVVLDVAEALAAEKGLVVTAGDIDREYELALKRLVESSSGLKSEQLDRAGAQDLLEAVLADRNTSEEEFRTVIRRNAYLRAIVESEQLITEEQVRQEYERVHAERVRIRHIQVAAIADVERIKERLTAGDDFSALARMYSANAASARAGGLLPPFSATDADVPELFRSVAFSLKPQEVSEALRIGPWYHFIRLEEKIPPQQQDFATVRDELEERVRDHLAQPAIERLFKELFQQAVVEIHDPVLRKAYEQRQSKREK